MRNMADCPRCGGMFDTEWHGDTCPCLKDIKGKRMNREQLLTRLAMEVSEWPTGPGPHRNFGCAAWTYVGSSEAWVTMLDIDFPSIKNCITRNEWLAERERLINNPSWDDAPKWAQWLAQDETGHWFWYTAKPYSEGGWCLNGNELCAYASEGFIPVGHNWYDTLEQRPADNTSAYTAAGEQPAPQGSGQSIASLVMHDLIERSEKGISTYGEALRANNGRSALMDAYQEALDLAMYLRQAIEESK